MAKRAAFAAAGILVILGLVGAAEAGESGSCVAPEARQFDFWVGSWAIRQQILRADGTWATFDARTSVEPALDGCALVEHWEGEVELFWEGMRAPARMSGLSVRAWDPESRQWSIHWMDSRNVRFDAPFVGAFHDGTGTFFRERKTGEETLLTRVVFSRIAASSVDWELAISKDDGATWMPLWTMKMTRSLVASAERFRAFVAAGDQETVRAMMGDDARRWWERREGEGAPWRPAVPGPWSGWDEHFHSRGVVVEWKESARAATAVVRETNDYFRLLERGEVTNEVTYFFDDAGRIDGLLVRGVGERPPGKTEAFLAWAKAHAPDELAELMPDGEIDPSGDHPQRFRKLLNRWRRDRGLAPIE